MTWGKATQTLQTYCEPSLVSQHRYLTTTTLQGWRVYNQTKQTHLLSPHLFVAQGSPLWHNKMQQRPQFFQGILQRSAWNKETAVCVKLHQRPVQQRIVILQTMRFINDQHSPAETAQERLVFHQNLISSKESIEFQLSTVTSLARMKQLILLDLQHNRALQNKHQLNSEQYNNHR